jgi:DNA repair protein RecO
MEILECPAIVVGYVDYLDHDKIVKLITAEHGLISAMAKGARRAKSRKFTHSLDLGNIVHVHLIPSKSHGAMWKLKEANLKKACHIARRDLYKTALITYACEVIYSLSAVETPEPKLYGLLETLIRQLNQRRGNEGFGPNYRIAFELKALSFAGLMPTLRRCVACTYPLTSNMKFNVVEGGVFHEHCLPIPSYIDKKRCEGKISSSELLPTHSTVRHLSNEMGSSQPSRSHIELSNENKQSHSKRRPTLYKINEYWRQCALKSLYSPMETSIGTDFPDGPNWLFSHMLEFHRQKPLKSKYFLRNIQELTQGT